MAFISWLRMCEESKTDQPALWSVKFRDGSPTVALAVDGSAWMTTGNVKAKSVFVDEIRRLASNANEVR